MEPTFVDLRYSRVFPYPVDVAYAWLTDYRDDDPQRTDAVVKRRPVLERTKDKVVLEGELEILGQRGTGRVEVALDPPAHWTATIVAGSGKGSVYDYHLTEVPGGSRLDVVYHIRVRRWKSRLKVLLMRPFAIRQIDRMWNGFDRSMRKELDAEPLQVEAA